MQEETQNNKEAYDYNAPIEKTSVELAVMVIAKMFDNKEFLIIESLEKADPIKKAAFIEKSTDFSIEVVKEIAKSDIPYPYATRCIDKIIITLEILKKYVDGTITQTEDELFSRVLGARDPENNKFTKQQSTVGNLMLKLEEVRQSTGNNKYDYFSEPAKPTSGPEGEDAGLKVEEQAPKTE